MGADALSLMLCHMEDDGTEIPKATDINTIKEKENETVSLYLPTLRNTDAYI